MANTGHPPCHADGSTGGVGMSGGTEEAAPVPRSRRHSFSSAPLIRGRASTPDGDAKGATPSSASASSASLSSGVQDRSMTHPGRISQRLPWRRLKINVENDPMHERLQEGPSATLWMAAREGDVDTVERILQEADPELDIACVMPQNDARAITYKGRKLSCQPIHAAVCGALSVDPATVQPRISHQSKSSSLPGHNHGSHWPHWHSSHLTATESLAEAVDSDQWSKSARIVELLLDASADVSSTAMTSQGESIRVMQVIHIAAGVGNLGVLSLLLDRKADPNAEAMIGEKIHYYPLHDAAFLNRRHAVQLLLNREADVLKKNNGGETALHIAAGQAYTKVVETLIRHASHDEDLCGLQTLLTSKTDKEELALTKAITSGRFPSSKLHFFTQDLNVESRFEAFKLVASECPSAASALLWVGEGCEEDYEGGRSSSTDIDPEWRKTFLKGAEDGNCSIDTLVELIEQGPEAAMYLIEALTDTPDVTDEQHNPLPVRSVIPTTYEPIQMTCAYKEDCVWDWSPKGTPKWQAQLAHKDSRNGFEVQTQVVRLKGIITMKVLLVLALSSDRRIFTKLAVHALLKHAWSRLGWIFVLETVHELIATLILSIWILNGASAIEHYYTRVALWTWVASRGIAECLMVSCMFFRVVIEKGLHAANKWLRITMFRVLVGVTTALLCLQLLPDFVPRKGNDTQSVLMAINSMLHWMFLLIQLRAFPSTGQKLLPIIKSIKTIAPMLLIVFFLMMAFVHGFWAFDMNMADDVRFFEVATMLFTGENMFVAREDLGEMPGGKRVLYILFAFSGLFLFLACALNVFIAVLGDCYDLEQERMANTYLQERARICCSCCLGPKFGGNRRWPFIMALTLPLGLVVVGVLILLSADDKHSASVSFGAWGMASGFALFFLMLNAFGQILITKSWDARYLWLCHKSNDDAKTLMEDCDDADKPESGRILRIKQHLHHRVQDLERKLDEMKMMQDEVASTCRKIAKSHKEQSERQDAILNKMEGFFDRLQDQSDLRSEVAALRENQEQLFSDVLRRQQEQGDACGQVLQLQQSTREGVEHIQGVLRLAAQKRNRNGRPVSAGPSGRPAQGQERGTPSEASGQPSSSVGPAMAGSGSQPPGGAGRASSAAAKPEAPQELS